MIEKLHPGKDRIKLRSIAPLLHGRTAGEISCQPTSTTMSDEAHFDSMSLVRGIPLADEPGVGALTIPGFLQQVTSLHGAREAVVMHQPDGVVRWSYADLWQRSTEVAQALIAAGAAKDSRVGILMTNRPEYLAALFGIALAGGVCVALSTFSTPEELQHLLQASGVSILLFEDRVQKKNFSQMLCDMEPAFASASPAGFASAKFPFLKKCVRLAGCTSDQLPELIRAFEAWNDFIAAGRGVSADIVAARTASVAPSDIGGIFFSSGTTSLPKGIIHSQRAFAIQWWRWPRVTCIREPVRCWTGNGFFWSANITMVVGIAFATGGAVILQPLFEAEEALRLIEAEKISFMNGREHQWARLQAASNWSSTDLSSLRYVTRREIIMQHPTVSCDWDVPPSYGTTETMTINCGYTSETSDAEYAGSFGEPLPGNILKIIDPSSGAIVARGERGEICIKGPTLMLGYIGKSAEDTFDDEGFFRTGDGGYVDAKGRLYWEGRLNGIIKTGGANVSPEEVDLAITRYPGVKRTQTVGVPDAMLGEMVVACIVPIEGVTLDEADIIAFLKTSLASYKLPRRVLFFAESEFALTGNEKAKAGDLKVIAEKRLSAPA
jgi:acyl-CoA synthetase (AMP-forming)/AMP-acid ligase II